MSTESLNCPNCGAPLLDPAGKTTVVCDHCGSVIALKLPAAPSAPAAPEPASYEPTYEYGQVPNQPLARSGLTSLALGPDDAAHVLQLLHDHQDLEAAQFYQAKTGSSPDEARDAISAIEAGLRDTSAPLSSAGRAALPDPADMPEVARLAANGDAIGAIKAYRTATGVGLREAKGRIDWYDEQLRRQAVAANPPPVAVPGFSRPRSNALGCPIGCLGILALFMCIFGGCGVYAQTRSIYPCSLSAIKAAVAKQELFAPPINAGYVVVISSFSESAGGRGYYLNMTYNTPVWGANGWGWVDAHVVDSGTGRKTITATLHKGGRSQVLLPTQQINCPQ